jgi:hypothetical protein
LLQPAAGFFRRRLLQNETKYLSPLPRGICVEDDKNKSDADLPEKD